MSKISVICDWILVEPLDEKEQVTASGIILAGKDKNDSVKRAKVIQISEDVKKLSVEREGKNPTKAEEIGDCLSYKEGDIILYYGKTGIAHTFDGKTLVFLKYTGMLGVEKGE